VDYKLEEDLEVVEGFIARPRIIREPRKAKKGEESERVYVVVNVYDRNGRLVWGEMPIESKAMWAYLRIVYGRKIDGVLKERYVDKGKVVISRAFVDLFKDSDRSLKIIVGENRSLKRGAIKSITTRWHQIIPLETVRYHVERALRNAGCEINPEEIVQKPHFAYYTAYYIFAKKDEKFFAASLGRNDTYFAIKFLYLDYDPGCTNIVIPMFQSANIRILRYAKNRFEIYKRIKKAVWEIFKIAGKYEELSDEAEKIVLTPGEAESLVKLFARQHGYGYAVIKAILERWENHEEHTLAGLSAALSYVSSNMPQLMRGRWTAFNLSSDAGRLITERKKLLKIVRKVRAR